MGYVEASMEIYVDKMCPGCWVDITWVLQASTLGSGALTVAVSHNSDTDNDYITINVQSPTATIYVPDDYSTIQAAVNAANPGDTIIVRDGTYTENVDVNKSITIQSENGTEHTIIQPADLADNIIDVTADYVTISGLQIYGTAIYPLPSAAAIHLLAVSYCDISGNDVHASYWSGIKLENSTSNTIMSNAVHDFYDNIMLINSASNAITGNNISGSVYMGLALSGSAGNTISDNNFTNDGIFLWDSLPNVIDNNIVNGMPLIYLDGGTDLTIPTTAGQVILVNCDHVTVEDLHVSNTSVGIELLGTSNSNIIRNDVSWGHRAGIYLGNSSNNNIDDNRISGYFGIELVLSIGNEITRNTSSSAMSLYGIETWNSDANSIYINDFIGYYGNAAGGANSLNSPDPITYSYAGKAHTNYLGNYWSDYTGSDANGDGIGDTPYIIQAPEQDNYPLIQPFENYHEFSYIGKYTTTAYAYPEEADSTFGSFKSARTTITVQKPDSTTVSVSVKRSFLDAMKMNGGGLVNSNPQSYVHLVQWTLSGNIFKEIEEVVGSQGRPLVAYQSIAKCPSDTKIQYADKGFFIVNGTKTTYEFSVDDTCPACCKKGSGIDLWLGVGKAAYSEALNWGKKTVDLYVYK